MFARHVNTRRTEPLEVRKEAAEFASLRPHPSHISNGEEGNQTMNDTNARASSEGLHPKRSYVISKGGHDEAKGT